jgi:hypothetical protein
LFDRQHFGQTCGAQDAQQDKNLIVKKSFNPESAHSANRAAVLRGLARSVFMNVACTYFLYRVLEPHFRSGSLIPLAVSGLLPLFGLAYGVVRQGSIDIIGLFAAEDIAVSLIALSLAHDAMSALVGRSLQNAALGALFLGSVLIKRPIMLYMARQFVTGNEASGALRFDQMAARPDARRVYRTMTLVWAFALFAKSVVSVVIALTCSTGGYLILSPLSAYGSDALLIWWSFNYGYSKLGHYADDSQTGMDERIRPTVQNGI